MSLSEYIDNTNWMCVLFVSLGTRLLGREITRAGVGALTLNTQVLQTRINKRLYVCVFVWARNILSGKVHFGVRLTQSHFKITSINTLENNVINTNVKLALSSGITKHYL